jgi:guanyl-specific ribonuclease Sa
MMKRFKKLQTLLLALILALTMTACSEEVTNAIVDEVVDIAVSAVVDAPTEESDDTAADAETPPAQEESSSPAEPAPEEETPPAEEAPAIDEDGYYTTKEDVALYIYTYGHLPDNFITKKEAESLGWSGGGLDDYAYGCCIGGNRFGNYEGLLPEANGRTYTECDIDTMHASKRGAKRIVFSNDGLIYYTDDHYESFTLLYGEE